MKEEIELYRMLAVKRFREGESPEAICTSPGKTKAWLYKWIKWHHENNALWNQSRSRRPLSTPLRTTNEIEAIVKMIRLISLQSRSVL